MSKANPKDLHVLYVNMLTEAAARTNFIVEVLNKKIEMPRRPAYETCYLQLRMICELIAIGCLAAHGGHSGDPLRQDALRICSGLDFGRS